MDLVNSSRVAWKSGPTQAPRPPMRQLRPLSGEVFNVLGQISAFFLEGYQQLGPAYRFHRAGQEFVVISGPEANLFVTQEGKNYLSAEAYRREQNEEFGVSQTLVSMRGNEHYFFRRLQKQGYSRSALNGRFPDLVATVQNLLNEWQPGQPQVVTEVMPRLIAEQLGIGVLNYPLGDYLEDILLWVRTGVIETVAKLRPRQVLDSPTYISARVRVMELADKVIAFHRSQPLDSREPDLVDDLLAALAEDENLMTEQELRIAVLGGYIGGLDTVAYTCAFMLYSLLKRPDLLARVTAEVEVAFADGVPDPLSLKNMETLHHVAMEVLRLYPVSPAIQANVSEPFEFAGYGIEEGQNLIIGSAVPHFLPEFFPDPLSFDVERYGEPRNEHRQRGAYAPFGLGEHLCLGAGMAEVLIMLTMATLLHTVRLEMTPPDYNLNIVALPTPKPDNNFRVRVVERKTK